MLIRKLALPTALLTFGALACLAQETKSPQPDNTRVNKRDRSKSESTADQQKMNKSDREIAKEIRHAIVSDKSLSSYAHNIKIIAENGNVTLKGPVRSEEEKRSVVAKATEVAGTAKITDELSVKSDSDADRKNERAPVQKSKEQKSKEQK